MFPEIKDWTSSQDHIRFQKNVKKLTYKEWFWFHPSSYSLLSYGVNVIGLIVFGAVFIFSIISKLYILAFILVILFYGNIMSLRNKIKDREYSKDLTFYDIWLRDYNLGEVK